MESTGDARYGPHRSLLTCARLQEVAMPGTDHLLNVDQWEHQSSARGLEQWIAKRRTATMTAALPLERRQHER